MTLCVVDACVVIKWLTPEVLSAESLRLRSLGVPLHSPEFLDVELAAIAWKKIRRDGMSRLDADFIVSQLPGLAIIRHPTTPLVAHAFEIADRTGRTVYDCLYLALAVETGGTLVTADERFANSLTGTPWSSAILKLKDVP